MSDAAVNGIIALTQNDPDFDAIFSNLFGIGEFIGWIFQFGNIYRPHLIDYLFYNNYVKLVNK